MLKRYVPGVGEIRRASGTTSPEVLDDLHVAVEELVAAGDLGPLRLVQAGLLRPLDLLKGRGEMKRRVRPVAPQLLYVIRATPSGNLKIGVANDVPERLRSLQCSTWETLEVACTMEGGQDLERRLHRKFAAHHIAREWFRPDPEVLAFFDLTGCDG